MVFPFGAPSAGAGPDRDFEKPAAMLAPGGPTAADRSSAVRRLCRFVWVELSGSGYLYRHGSDAGGRCGGADFVHRLSKCLRPFPPSGHDAGDTAAHFVLRTAPAFARTGAGLLRDCFFAALLFIFRVWKTNEALRPAHVGCGGTGFADSGRSLCGPGAGNSSKAETGRASVAAGPQSGAGLYQSEIPAVRGP